MNAQTTHCPHCFELLPPTGDAFCISCHQRLNESFNDSGAPHQNQDQNPEPDESQIHKDPILSKLLQGVGGAISVFGIAVVFCNVSGYYVSFPFAGFLTMSIGGGIASLGGRFSKTYTFTCAHCGGQLQANKCDAGKTSTCGTCGGEIVLP